MVLNFKKKKTYLRHEQSKVPARGDLLALALGLGIVDAHVGRFLLDGVDAQAQAVQRLGIGLGELDRIGDRRSRKGRQGRRGCTAVDIK